MGGSLHVSFLVIRSIDALVVVHSLILSIYRLIILFSFLNYFSSHFSFIHCCLNVPFHCLLTGKMVTATFLDPALYGMLASASGPIPGDVNEGLPAGGSMPPLAGNSPYFISS